MWLFFGIGAILFAILNFVWSKYREWFTFTSLSLTALVVCDFYRDAGIRIENNDIGYLMDVVPTASKVLWFLVIASIIINLIPLIFRKVD